MGENQPERELNRLNGNKNEPTKTWMAGKQKKSRQLNKLEHMPNDEKRQQTKHSEMW